MPKVCSRVLTLPPRPAAITPCRITQNRTAVMPHSRTSTTMVTHHQTSPMIDSPTRAIVDQRLVGDRVDDLAEVGHQAAAAGQVTVDPVGDHRDGEHAERRSQR